MTSNATIEQAVERLAAAYREAGLPPIRPAGDVNAILDQIRTEIAPLRLPAEFERFWRVVDPESITVAPYPRPTSLAFALRCWTAHRDDTPGMVPRLLFPVAYESHGFLLVELEDGRGSGGAVLQWAYAGSPFEVRFPDLAAYVDLLATMIESDELARHGSYIEFDPHRRWEDALAVRLTAAQPLPRFGDVRTLDEDVRHWPEHWLLADGLTPETRTPRGATTTVSELVHRAAAASVGATVEGTVRARVTSLSGTAAGRRITIDDGTGVLDVWCPARVCAYGPAIRSEFELDVVVQARPGPPPDSTAEHRAVEASARAHDLAGAQSAAAELYATLFGTPAAAEATAIRPVG